MRNQTPNYNFQDLHGMQWTSFLAQDPFSIFLEKVSCSSLTISLLKEIKTRISLQPGTETKISVGTNTYTEELITGMQDRKRSKFGKLIKSSVDTRK